MKAGNLSGMLCNCHIYENHMEQCREQASRTPGSLPGLEFDEDKWTGMFDWQATESSLHDYYPQAAIKAEVAI
jgi:thymidylate synthase